MNDQTTPTILRNLARATWGCTLAWLSGASPAAGQSPPPPLPGTSIYDAQPLAGNLIAASGDQSFGNPFWPGRGARLRSTRLNLELYGDGAQPNLVPTPAVQSANIPTPIVPRHDDQVRPASFDAMQTPPVPAPMTPPAAAAPAQAPHGIALLLQQPADPQRHQLTPVAAWLEDALRQMNAIQDYSCTFKKREAIDGRLQDYQPMYVKVRCRPFSVYMFFLHQSVYGQEAVYIEGRNNGHLLAHPVGIKQKLVGTLSLAPTDPQAMEGNRYPITDFGMQRLAERFLERTRNDMQYGECEVRVIENTTVEERACTCVQIVHPVPRREFGYYMSRLFIDNELNVPIRCENYDWPKRPGESPQLIEEYTYSNLKLNQGFTDADFDAANPNYGFK